MIADIDLEISERNLGGELSIIIEKNFNNEKKIR